MFPRAHPGAKSLQFMLQGLPPIDKVCPATPPIPVAQLRILARTHFCSHNGWISLPSCRLRSSRLQSSRPPLTLDSLLTRSRAYPHNAARPAALLAALANAFHHALRCRFGLRLRNGLKRTLGLLGLPPPTALATGALALPPDA